MDYRYIEQLLERYWAAETTLQEERILREFFSDETQVPAHLKRYRSLFAGLHADSQTGLGDDFSERLLRRVEQPTVEARRLTLVGWMKPLMKSAALIALLITVGTVTERSMMTDDGPMQARTEAQRDSATVDVQVAYEPTQAVDSTRIIDETLLK
jgi:hypothetical protein